MNLTSGLKGKILFIIWRGFFVQCIRLKEQMLLEHCVQQISVLDKMQKRVFVGKKDQEHDEKNNSLPKLESNQP